MRTRTLAATLVAGVLALSACTGGNGTDPSPTPSATASTSPSSAPSVSPTASPTSSPTPTVSPTPTASPTPSPTPTAADVPDDLSTITDDGEVTIAEAQAVIDAQDEIYNDAVIALLTRPKNATGGPSVEFFDELAKVYTSTLRDGYADAWVEAAQEDFDGYNTEDPSGVANTVTKVLSAVDSCFFVEMKRDGNGISDDDDSIQDYWASIRNDGNALLDSPTGWHRDIETFTPPEPDEDFCEQEPVE